mmetsp:Transcript_7212/g.11421  ORF Transcript_7212/g.11421 Transcript_7212/m.11421 type:complete len:279 (-) Transcript_7212:985-1821(-)
MSPNSTESVQIPSSPPKRPTFSGLAKELARLHDVPKCPAMPSPVVKKTEYNRAAFVECKPTVEQVDTFLVQKSCLKKSPPVPIYREVSSPEEAFSRSDNSSENADYNDGTSSADFFVAEQENSRLRARVSQLESLTDSLRLQLLLTDSSFQRTLVEMREQDMRIAELEFRNPSEAVECHSCDSLRTELEILREHVDDEQKFAEDLKKAHEEIEALRAERDGKDNLITALRRQLNLLGVTHVQGIPTRGFLSSEIGRSCHGAATDRSTSSSHLLHATIF